jgi:carbonic anhydrase/acetyltransferase-like protein (isoleucine patch superfamily)
MSGEDKRRHVRLPMVVECSVDGILGQGMRLSDLSLSGCYVDTSTHVAMGSTVAIAAVLKGHPVVLNGRVVHTHERIGFGVQFEALPAEVVGVIQRFLG